jgi:hypothetical protein
MFFRNVGIYVQVNTTLLPTRQTSYPLLNWERTRLLRIYVISLFLFTALSCFLCVGTGFIRVVDMSGSVHEVAVECEDTFQCLGLVQTVVEAIQPEFIFWMWLAFCALVLYVCSILKCGAYCAVSLLGDNNAALCNEADATLH